MTRNNICPLFLQYIMYNNIVLPIDREHKSNIKSAKEAIKIAEAFDSTITVLYVKMKADKEYDDNKEIEPIRDMREFFEENNCANINYIVL